MADESLLRQAWLLYKQGRFSTALEALEPKVFQFRDNAAFFRILGLCCLQQGDWKGGETYLKRSQQLDENGHRDTLLGLMAVAARRKDYAEAVGYALELLDRGEDATAKRGLARLRQALAGPEAAPGLDSDTLVRWLPTYRRVNPGVRRWALRIGIGAVLAVAVAAGSWWGLSLVSPKTGPARVLPVAASISGAVVETGPGVLLTLTEDEVRQGWQRAQKAFQDYRDSQARYEINRLLLSNAAPAFKERARSLIAYLHAPDYSRSDDSVAYSDVKSSPRLYEGCAVKWPGVLTNLVSGETKITFDLLLGYQDGQVVEGIVPVELDFAALLKNSQVVEVLGRVALNDTGWLVLATSLRQIGYRAP